MRTRKKPAYTMLRLYTHTNRNQTQNKFKFIASPNPIPKPICSHTVDTRAKAHINTLNPFPTTASFRNLRTQRTCGAHLRTPSIYVYTQSSPRLAASAYLAASESIQRQHIPRSNARICSTCNTHRKRRQRNAHPKRGISHMFSLPPPPTASIYSVVDAAQPATTTTFHCKVIVSGDAHGSILHTTTTRGRRRCVGCCARAAGKLEFYL